MRHFSTEKMGRIFVVSLDQGDYLLESILDLIRKEDIRDAVVVSAVGTLDQCRFHLVTTVGYPPEDRFEQLVDSPLELVSVNGLIANGEPHLHILVSDSERSYSGHLEKGCRVLYLAEIVLVELKSTNLMRVRDDKHILKLTAISSKANLTSRN